MADMEDSNSAFGRRRGRARKSANSRGGRGRGRSNLSKEAQIGDDSPKSGDADSSRDGPALAFFSYSTQSYLKMLDIMISLCSEDEQGMLDQDAVERFTSAVNFVEEWRQFCNQMLVPVQFAHEYGFPKMKDVLHGFDLPQFSAAVLPKTGRESIDGNPVKERCDNYMLQVGGRVWALDWCPRPDDAPNSGPSCEYLAVAAHPADSSLNQIGAVLRGEGFIQIWFFLNIFSEDFSLLSCFGDAQQGGLVEKQNLAYTQHDIISSPHDVKHVSFEEHIQPESSALVMLSNLDSSMATSENSGAGKKRKRLKQKARTGVAGNIKDVASLNSCERHVLNPTFVRDFAVPRIFLCLAHDGKVAWDAKWQPCAENYATSRERIGFLAVLLGDGSMQVWEVPSPCMVKRQYSSSNKEGIDPRFMRLKPVFQCSKLQCGGRRSIPLTMEWSASAPHDTILVGCHDGTVALWKFLPKSSSQDTRPLIFFTADSLPIRAVSWSPFGRDVNSDARNVIVTAGHSGSLKFWDIRDPFRPLWDLHLPRGIILSVDWVEDPRCIIYTVDDGTIRIINMLKAASEVPLTGKSCTGKLSDWTRNYYSSSFAIWSVHISKRTGSVAYCGADGSALHFELNEKLVDKDPRRGGVKHYLCGALAEGRNSLIYSVPLMSSPVPMQKPRVSSQPNLASSGFDDAGMPEKNTQSKKSCSGKKNCSAGELDKEEDPENITSQDENVASTSSSAKPGTPVEEFPPKSVALHKIRWNPNKGSENWICYGGAAGIVFCHPISTVDSTKRRR